MVFLFDAPGTDLEVDAEEDSSGEEDQEAEPPVLVTPEVDGTAETPKGYDAEEDEQEEEPPDAYLDPKTLWLATSPAAVANSSDYPNDKISRLDRIQVNRQVGIPVAFQPPGQKTDERRGYKLLPTWNAKGSLPARSHGRDGR